MILLLLILLILILWGGGTALAVGPLINLLWLLLVVLAVVWVAQAIKNSAGR